ncbi:hypothetical protein [Paractinoplanes maris]|uniref:hypothetical protein n=1 Tax=Paractinoplanes maris TaxID=1734446 RepID=UPI0020224E14|nr:hypothetical protein [Actinoplanes maris]
MANRSLRRTLPVMVVALSAVAGCAGGAGSPTSPSGPATTLPSATTAAGSAPSGSSGAARTIPASAFLTMPEDMRRERRAAEGSAAVPKLCDRELAAGEGVVASAAMMNLYQGPDAPEGSVPQGVLYQTIRSYDGDSATGFLDRARDGLAACKSFRNGETTIKVRTKPLSGAADEALTIDLVQPQLDLPGDPTGGEQTNRIVLLRFGSVVTILYDSEYERSSSDPELVSTFVRDAGEAIRAWRG